MFSCVGSCLFWMALEALLRMSHSTNQKQVKQEIMMVTLTFKSWLVHIFHVNVRISFSTSFNFVIHKISTFLFGFLFSFLFTNVQQSPLTRKRSNCKKLHFFLLLFISFCHFMYWMLSDSPHKYVQKFEVKAKQAFFWFRMTVKMSHYWWDEGKGRERIWLKNC